eukprot:COSAG06_NODE_54381_length_307_cov_0.234694_1_plen_48_part_10
MSDAESAFKSSPPGSDQSGGGASPSVDTAAGCSGDSGSIREAAARSRL